MSKRVILKVQAGADIEAALAYHVKEARHVVAGLRASFESTLAKIGETPGTGSARYSHELDVPGLRAQMTKGFPYLVFYIEGSAEISVLRVLHQSRDVFQVLESSDD